MSDASRGRGNLAALAAIVVVALALFGAPRAWAGVASMWAGDERSYPKESDVRHNPVTGEAEMFSGGQWVDASGATVSVAASGQPTTNKAVKSPTPTLRHWSGFPIHYCWAPVQGRVTPQMTALTDRAFQTWGVSASYDGVCAGQPELGNGINEIAIGALTAPVESAGGMQEAGVTRSECVGGTEAEGCALVEADIVLDYQTYTSTPGTEQVQCLLSTLIHETGHMLGLAHMPPPSVMQTGTSDCPIALSASDKQAFRDRYGSP